MAYTPGELAVLFEMLLELASLSETQGDAFATASSLLLIDTVASRVQLTDDSSFWQSHMGVLCDGLAGVLGRYSGTLPAIP